MANSRGFDSASWLVRVASGFLTRQTGLELLPHRSILASPELAGEGSALHDASIGRRRNGMTEASANEPGIFEIMHTTRSMRRLKPGPVPNALIRQILEAGVSAANGGNMQRWRFLVVKDPKVKETVIAPALHRPGRPPSASSACSRLRI